MVDMKRIAGGLAALLGGFVVTLFVIIVVKLNETVPDALSFLILPVGVVLSVYVARRTWGRLESRPEPMEQAA